MKQNIQHDGTRYRISLSWKKKSTMLLLKTQLESLQRRLEKNKQSMQLCDHSLATDIDKVFWYP